MLLGAPPSFTPRRLATARAASCEPNCDNYLRLIQPIPGLMGSSSFRLGISHPRRPNPEPPDPGSRRRKENIPLTIDANYVVGFNYTRQWQIRAVDDVARGSVSACRSKNPATIFGASTATAPLNAAKVGLGAAGVGAAAALGIELL